MRYEYKVVPAPARGEKAKGVKGAEARFAYGLEHLLNDMGVEGWAFQRAETLPSEERAGLTGSVTVWRTVLVFQRAVAEARALGAHEAAADPNAGGPNVGGLSVGGLGAAGLSLRPQAVAADRDTEEPEAAAEPDWQRPVPTEAAEDIEGDNGVEETRDIDRPLGLLQARAKRTPEA